MAEAAGPRRGTGFEGRERLDRGSIRVHRTIGFEEETA
jgi:hypothetical protein